MLAGISPVLLPGWGRSVVSGDSENPCSLPRELSAHQNIKILTVDYTHQSFLRAKAAFTLSGLKVTSPMWAKMPTALLIFRNEPDLLQPLIW